MGQPTQRATHYTARSNIDTAQIFLYANGQRPNRAMIRQRSRRRQRRGEPHTEHGPGVLLAKFGIHSEMCFHGRFIYGVKPSAWTYYWRGGVGRYRWAACAREIRTTRHRPASSNRRSLARNRIRRESSEFIAHRFNPTGNL